MADITKCKGEDCQIKEKCYRYTTNVSMYQSYFSESPIKDNKCVMFWGINSEFIFNQLKEIINKQH